MISGSILKKFKIPIRMEIKIIGSSTFKKNVEAPSFCNPPNTNSTPPIPKSISLLNNLETNPITTTPISVFSMMKERISCVISISTIGLNRMPLRL